MSSDDDIKEIFDRQGNKIGEIRPKPAPTVSGDDDPRIVASIGYGFLLTLVAALVAKGVGEEWYKLFTAWGILIWPVSAALFYVIDCSSRAGTRTHVATLIFAFVLAAFAGFWGPDYSSLSHPIAMITYISVRTVVAYLVMIAPVVLLVSVISLLFRR